jgi:Tfp pilus assembly protein PilP
MRALTHSIVAVALSTGFALSGCGDEPPPKKPSAKAAAAAPVATTGAQVAAAAAKTVEDIRKKQLKDDDFVESQTNRDPFHSFISELSQSKTRAPADYQVYFDKFACEELKLIAVITGGLDPRALFRDPSGLGIPLHVGDHMCRAHWRIKRIVNEGVYVELEQDMGGVRPKLVERLLPINMAEDVK